MPTFAQLQDSLSAIRFRRAIVGKIVEWLDEQFLPGMEGTPRLALLTEDKVRVPDKAFDEVAEYLNSWGKSLAAEEEKLLGAEVVLVAPPPVEPPKEETPAAPTEVQEQKDAQPEPVPTEESK
jgi:hypothetical protein